MSPPRPQVPWPLMLDGLSDAVERLRAVPAGDRDAAFKAVFECVAWGGAARDYLRSRKLHAAIPDELTAVAFVRNLALHKSAEVFRRFTSTGSKLPMKLGTSGLGAAPSDRWDWPSRAALPRRREAPGNEEAGYDRHLAGQPVLKTLLALTEQLRQIDVPSL